MKKAEVLDCPPLPCRGSRKSVNWAPPFNAPEKDKTRTITRRSSRLNSQASAGSKPDPNCKLLENSSTKEKVGSTEDKCDGEEPTGIVNHTTREGKRQRETPAAGLAEQKVAQKTPSEARTCSNLNLPSRGQEVVGDVCGKEEWEHGDHGMSKETSKGWVSVPLDNMESVGNTRTRYKRECRKVSQFSVRSSNNKTMKSETDQKVAVGNISGVCPKLVMKNDRAELDDQTLEALREIVTGVEGVIYDVGHMVQTLKERKLQGVHAEKTKYEATAVAKQQKLRDEISKLKRKNQIVQSEKLRIKRERDRLKKDYVGMLDSTKDAQRLHAEREVAAIAALTDELAKERDKSSCQICFNTPRDAVVLPCMHFQYCNECLQKHQQRNAECPTCRGKINGVLRCNLGTT